MKLPKHEIANKIEDYCRFPGRIFPFVQNLGVVNEALKQGNHFLHSSLLNSLTLFSTAQTTLLSAQPVDDKLWAAEAENDW